MCVCVRELRRRVLDLIARKARRVISLQSFKWKKWTKTNKVPKNENLEEKKICAAQKKVNKPRVRSLLYSKKNDSIVSE